METDEMAPEWFHRDSIPFGKMWADDVSSASCRILFIHGPRHPLREARSGALVPLLLR